MGRGLVAVLGWAVAVSSATAVSVAAVDLLGEGITGRSVQPLSPAEVERALDQATATPPGGNTASPSESPSGSPSASPGASGGVTRVLAVGGGTVVASCARGQVTIRSWSPNQHFTADLKDRGPDRTASIEFESDDEEYEVDVSCDDSGAPVAQTAADDGHRGRGDD